jgi:YHS domain-containing protein
MKTIFKSTLLVLSSFAFLSCKGEKEANNEQSPPSESGAKPYSLETCLVSGKKLGSMGDPYVIVHEGQEIKFCCDGCEPTFKKDPAKFLAKLENQ